MPTATTAANSAAVTSFPPSLFPLLPTSVQPPSLFSSFANDPALLESFTRHLLLITRLPGSWRHVLVQGWGKKSFFSIRFRRIFVVVLFMYRRFKIDKNLVQIFSLCMNWCIFVKKKKKMERSVFVIRLYVY